MQVILTIFFDSFKIFTMYPQDFPALTDILCPSSSKPPVLPPVPAVPAFSQRSASKAAVCATTQYCHDARTKGLSVPACHARSPALYTGDIPEDHPGKSHTPQIHCC